MFDENIDVAAIMREIKAGVIGKQDDSTHQKKYYTDEIDRITDFIVNVKNESARYQDIGSCLPACKRFPAFIAFLFRAAARVIRKSVSFIIRDQIVFNHNTNDMIQALIERDDSMLEFAEKQIKELQSRVITLDNKVTELERKISACDGKEELFDENQYLSFENNFRGNTNEIKSRLKYYIDNYIGEANSSNCIAIDIGCGRGEWMQLMNARGYKTIGVDTNARMVYECIDNGLNAVCDDAVSYLGELESNSVSVVSAFQVIEHMTKTKVMQLIVEAKRVLVQHGLLLLETPNIQNLEVGAGSFYLDPTHINPMHPELLLYMVENSGFQEAKIVYWKKDAVDEWIRELLEQDEMNVMDSNIVRTILETMKEKIYVSPDYAIVAKKLR